MQRSTKTQQNISPSTTGSGTFGEHKPSSAPSAIENAKNAVKEFMSRDKHHSTEVHEYVNPAIEKLTIKPAELQETTTAIDREIHKDHYQTRVQPIVDQQVGKEEHRHHVLAVEHQHTNRGHDKAEIKRRLEQEKLQFKSTREVLPTTRTEVNVGTIHTSHAHHHVHETVQPVIERELVQPVVVHTTIPIHERIEHEPTFHPATIQPKISMEEYTRAGGVLDGNIGVKREVFSGEPQVVENGGADMIHPYAHHHDHDDQVQSEGNYTTSGGKSSGMATREAGAVPRSMRGSKIPTSTGGIDNLVAGSMASGQRLHNRHQTTNSASTHM